MIDGLQNRPFQKNFHISWELNPSLRCSVCTFTPEMLLTLMSISCLRNLKLVPPGRFELPQPRV